MENSITQVLDQQILEIENAIEANKTKIGDSFLKIHSHKIVSDFTPETLRETFKELDKMAPLLSNHEKYLTKLETLQKTKAEVERLETGLIAK